MLPISFIYLLINQAIKDLEVVRRWKSLFKSCIMCITVTP